MDISYDHLPTRPDSLISIIVPAYNEEENLRHLYMRVRKVMEQAGWGFEMILVDNGSTDRSLEVIKGIRQEDKRVHYLSLSRNFGHQGALVAALEHSRGDAVISMDADLQHPPEVIPEMLSLWNEGYEVVYTMKREDAAQSLPRRLINRVFYTTLSRLSGLELSGGQSDFRLMDRRAVNALLNMPERNKFLRGLAKWIGFRQIGVEYDVPPRFAGESKFRFVHLFRFALDGMLSFSILPLRLFTLLGIIAYSCAFLYGIFIVGSGAYALLTGYHGHIPPGWASISAAIIFFSGMQLIGIGLLGEYLGRVYDETKQRPVYLIRERSIQTAHQHDTPNGIFTTQREVNEQCWM